MVRRMAETLTKKWDTTREFIGSQTMCFRDIDAATMPEANFGARPRASKAGSSMIFRDMGSNLNVELLSETVADHGSGLSPFGHSCRLSEPAPRGAWFPGPPDPQPVTSESRLFSQEVAHESSPSRAILSSLSMPRHVQVGRTETSRLLRDDPGVDRRQPGHARYGAGDDGAVDPADRENAPVGVSSLQPARCSRLSYPRIQFPDAVSSA